MLVSSDMASPRVSAQTAWPLAIVLLCGCQADIGGRLPVGPFETIASPDAEPLAPEDAGPEPDTAELGAWGSPQPISGAADAINGEDDCVLSSTTTELIYAVKDPDGGTGKDLYVMTREDPTSAWGTPQELTELSSDVAEETPRLSPDDLTLYFGRDGDIYSSTRSAIGAAWSAPVPVDSVNTAAYEKWLAVCDDGHVMISRRNADSASQDLYEGTLTGGAMTLVSDLSSSENEISVFLSPDCNTVYFASNRSGEMKIYTATRASVTDPWSAPEMVTSPFADGTDDEDAWISADQRTFVFASIRGDATTKDLYIATR